MKKIALLGLLVLVAAGLSGCITDGQGPMARAINNSLMSDVDPSFCQTMKGKPESVFREFVKKNKMGLNGVYPAIGDLYPVVYTYERGNFRAAVTYGQVYGIKMGFTQYHLVPEEGDLTKPVQFIECWRGTSPEPPGRREYMGVKM